MYTEKYDALEKWIKIVAQVILGALISGVYRILRYLETKNIVTLVLGILCFFGLGFVFWVIDLVTTVTQNKITVFAE